MQSLDKWLDQFSAAVRARDFEAGAALFDPQVHAYGSVAERAVGLATLREQQWRQIWPATRNFHFDRDERHFELSQDGSLALVCAEWTSEWIAPSDAPPRRGRASFELRRSPDSDEWKAVHSHFSLVPSGNANVGAG